MADLRITHTHETGTLLDGTQRGDGTAALIKPHGWRWGRQLEAWYLPGSRDRVAGTARIGATVAALEAAGHAVSVGVDDAPRAPQVVEQDRERRQDARVARLDQRAARLDQAAAAAEQRMIAAGDRLPPGGEPVKVGHHSERRHRRDLDRARTTLLASVEADQAAAEARRRAEVAAKGTQARHNPVTVANRIRRLEADRRRFQRSLDGHRRTLDARAGVVEEVPAAAGPARDRLVLQLQDVTEQLAYWTGVQEEQQSSGAAPSYGPAVVSAGDAVLVRGQWRHVVRANPKSVTLQTGYSWTDRVPWHEVTAHRQATGTS